MIINKPTKVLTSIPLNKSTEILTKTLIVILITEYTKALIGIPMTKLITSPTITLTLDKTNILIKFMTINLSKLGEINLSTEIKTSSLIRI